MRHFLFEDYDSGENFIVGADDEIVAMDIAKGFFADPSFIDEISEEEAEASGLDEY